MFVSPSLTSQHCTKTAKHSISQTTSHNSSWTLVLWCKRSLQNSNGITPNWGAKCRWVGKNGFSTSWELSHCTAKNLCPSVIVVCVQNGMLAEEFAMSLTTLVVVEIRWSQLWSSWHQQDWIYGSLLMTPTTLHACCVIVEQCTFKTADSGIKRGSCWKCSSGWHLISVHYSYSNRTILNFQLIQSVARVYRQ